MLMKGTLKPTGVHPTAQVPFPSTKQQEVRVADGLCVHFVGHTPQFSDTSAVWSVAMLDYNFKLWKIMVLSFTQCGVILHFLSSWGWKWRVPEHSAWPFSSRGLHRHMFNRSSGQAIRKATLRAHSRMGEVGNTWGREVPVRIRLL